MSCANNLRQLGLAFQNYHTALGRFPGGNIGKSTSKRHGNSPNYLAEVLPYMEGSNISDQMDMTQAYNSGANRFLLTLEVPFLQCPSDDDDNRLDKNALLNNETMVSSNYNAIQGPMWDFDPVYSNSPTNNNPDANPDTKLDDDVGMSGRRCGGFSKHGVIYPGSMVGIRQITDGTSNTLMMGERLYQLRAWIRGTNEQGMCTSNSKNMRYGINLQERDGFSYSPSSGPDGLEFNDLFFSSHHPGGAHFARCDGGVFFQSETVGRNVLMNLSTKAGGEQENDLEPELSGSTPPPPPPGQRD